MESHRKDIDVYPAACNRINQAVLVGNTARPQSLQVAFKWFRLSYASKGMCLNVFK